ncbi:uncharacterized protein TRIADDRAFT_64278 [Trichoplax adhaerens]|uniref:Uncharacterized protein n=1 Tax=Trichoplax adhaerens TaxID=10228 RepID=B3S899_TRIAD|nr:hypothetical protein TRIADDRAFT_64278 [Trichoplax adhaerens]EDV21064.1 hypothetical protein TRIADDRAFT_64278 [Trichoplax adhaerens]|eukprot:XP_002116394.1 hypothetical protein TRIADDRAFT_64278 [Trichoplax adhaerens]
MPTPNNFKGKVFGISELYNGSFYARSVYVSWISDTSYEYTDTNGDLVEYDVSTNTTKVLLPYSQKNLLKIARSWISPDGLFLLLSYQMRYLYRYSFYARYIVYRISDKQIFYLEPMGSGKELRYMGWSASGHKLSFVFGNDVYVLSDPTNDKNMVRLTTTGVDKVVFNGVPDWNNEEEILSSNNAIYWSKGSTYVCYGSFNATGVGSAHWVLYNGKGSYTSIVKVPYPKSGSINSKVTIYVTKANDAATTLQLMPPTDFLNGEYYYTNVVWASDTVVTVTWLNRFSNVSALMSCDATNGQCREINRVSEPNGWIDYHYYSPKFTTAGDSYYAVLPRKGSSGKSFFHLAKVSLTNSQKTWLTSGDWHVTVIYAYSESRNLLFFQSTEKGSITRNVYSIATDGSNKKCLSCSVRPNECEYFTGSFSSSGNYYVLGCRGPGIPSYQMINSITGATFVMESNERLKNAVASITVSTRVYGEFAHAGFKMNYVMYRPPGFDASKKYPVFMYMKYVSYSKYSYLKFHSYGGPQSQRVNKEFGLGWAEYFSSYLNTICIVFDPRGTGYKSNEFMYSTYKKLGVLEAQDVQAFGRYLQTLPYVDGSNMGVFGWSYGGYATGMVIGENNNVFKLGLMVAPVSDWRFYDTGYTERFMLTPQANPTGYEQASILNRLDGFKNATVFIAHGNADDNVHFQNTAVLAHALQTKQIQFKMMACSYFVINGDILKKLKGGLNKFSKRRNTSLKWIAKAETVLETKTRPLYVYQFRLTLQPPIFDLVR